jgi:hypothetical protein
MCCKVDTQHDWTCDWVGLMRPPNPPPALRWPPPPLIRKNYTQNSAQKSRRMRDFFAHEIIPSDDVNLLASTLWF